MKLYVNAKSKKEINATLNLGKPVYGVSYGLDRESTYALDNRLADGTVIAVYQKFVSFPGEAGRGSPYATRYGTWCAKTGRVK